MRLQIRWGGLRIKIIAWSFVPTAIVLAAVALVGFYAYQQVTQDLTIQSSRELTRLSAAQLAAELSGYTNPLTTLARTASIYEQNPAEQRAALAQASNRLFMFDGGVLILDSHGAVIAAQPARPEILGQDWSSRDYFRQMIGVPGTIFSNVVNDGPGGVPVIVVAVPITNPRGELVGTLAGMFRVSANSSSVFYGSIVKLRVDTNDAAYLVDHSGLVLYHSNADWIGRNLGNLPLVQQLNSGKADALRTRDTTGREIVASFAPVPGTPWGFVTEQSWQVLLARGQRYGQFLFLLLVLGLVAPALVVMVGVQRITEPINQLIIATKQVADGNLGHTTTVQTRDEIEELSRQFNRMSDRLAESYAALKERGERLALVIQGTNDGIWDWNLETNEVYFSPRWKAMLGYADHEIPNSFDEWRRLTHPDDLDCAQVELQAYLNGEMPVYQLEHRLQHKDGSYRWVLARGIALRHPDGKPYRMAGSHTDITERKHAEEVIRQAQQALEQRVAERTYELATLNTIAEVVSQSRDLKQIMNAALTRSLEVMRMEVGTAYSLQGSEGPDEEKQLVLAARLGLSAEFSLRVGQRRVRGTAIQAAAAQQKPVVQLVENYPDLQVKQALELEGVRQVINIPLLVKGKFVGVFNLGTRQEREITPEELSLLAAIGHQVAIAVENVHLYDQAEQSAALAERTRLARELHDSVTQSLYSVTMFAEAAQLLLTSGDHVTAAEHLRELRDTALEALGEMRLLIYELRPLALEKAGLAAALQERLETVEARGGVKPDLQVQGADHLPLAVQQEFYHIAQEALNNVIKHAHAHCVHVRLHAAEHSACLEIGDDGVGFDLANMRGGLGLGGMRERVQKMGGQLEIESAIGKGTQIKVEVPL